VFIHDNEYSYFSDDDIFSGSRTFYKMLEVPAKSPITQVTFDNIPTGKYAISAFHDEDKDRRLDRKWLILQGMPNESYGYSNASFAYFSKGPFENALVDINPPTTNVTIKLSTHLSKIVGN